jgi:hypothetical protein
LNGIEHEKIEKNPQVFHLKQHMDAEARAGRPWRAVKPKRKYPYGAPNPVPTKVPVLGVPVTVLYQGEKVRNPQFGHNPVGLGLKWVIIGSVD